MTEVKEEKKNRKRRKNNKWNMKVVNIERGGKTTVQNVIHPVSTFQLTIQDVSKRSIQFEK